MAILELLNLADWTNMQLGVAMAHCLCADPPNRLKSRVMSNILNAGVLVKSLFISLNTFSCLEPFTRPSCGLVQWLGNLRETWYPDSTESSCP